MVVWTDEGISKYCKWKQHTNKTKMLRLCIAYCPESFQVKRIEYDINVALVFIAPERWLH